MTRGSEQIEPLYLPHGLISPVSTDGLVRKFRGVFWQFTSVLVMIVVSAMEDCP
jgi:hypothetical protein